MGKFGDWFASIDERYAVRRTEASGGLQESRRGAAWVLIVFGLVVSGLTRALVDDLVPSLFVMAALVVSLVSYVIWRRARNKRLTGSPTTWPTGVDAD